MICNKCRQNNSNFYNYCANDGENLDNLSKKFSLQDNLNKHCVNCGSSITENQNYCTNCGKMFYKINKKNDLLSDNKVNDFIKKSEPINFSSFKLNKTSFENFKNINKQGIIYSVGLTLILCSIIVIISNLILYSDSNFYNQIQSFYGYAMPSTFKLFIFNLVSLNVPSIKMTLNISLVNSFDMSFAARNIICPLIVGLSMYISVNNFMAKHPENNNNYLIENSLACAILYSIIMVLLGIIGSYSFYIEENSYIVVGTSLINLFINSFIISFIGAYIAISKNTQDNMIVNFLKNSSNNILKGIGIIAILLGILSVIGISQYGYSQYISSSNSVKDNLILFSFAIIGFIILASWLFTLSNFVGITFFGIKSFTIISLTQDMNFPVIFLSIIPITLLILAGRKIKSDYGEHQIKTIAIYSSTYAVSMFALSYFSKITLSLKSGQIEQYLSEFIYELISRFNYNYASIANQYINNICQSLKSGVSMGSNLLLTIIVTFIFSFIFIFLGYKSKKINNN